VPEWRLLAIPEIRVDMGVRWTREAYRQARASGQSWPRPRYTWQVRRFYSDDDVRMLGGLGVSLDETTVKWLEGCAVLCLLIRHNLDHALCAPARALLRQLQDHPDLYRLRLLHDDAGFFDDDARCCDDIAWNFLTRAMAELPAGRLPDRVACWEEASGACKLKWLCLCPEPVQRQVLHWVTSRALELFDAQCPVTVGRPPETALRWFVEQVARFWATRTGTVPKRSFNTKLNREDGKFLDFVRAALRPVERLIDPKEEERPVDLQPSVRRYSGIVKRVLQELGAGSARRQYGLNIPDRRPSAAGNA
jgi:hypothetical protein